MATASSQLRVSFGGEDWRTELSALQISPGDHVLCVTGGGDTPLHLLLSDAQSVTAIDPNAAQDHLLQLKRAALSEFSFPDYLSFLGALPSSHREERLEDLLLHMDVESSLFWSQHRRMIADGVLFQGALERWAQWIHQHLPDARRDQVDALFSQTSLHEQRCFLEGEWDDAGWETIFEQLLAPLRLQQGTSLYARLRRCMERTLARRSPRLALLLRGRVPPEAFPLYLRREGAQAIKPRLGRLRCLNGNPLEHLEETSYDAFALSDRGFAMADFDDLLRAMIRSARPGARFCIRLSNQTASIPPDLEPYLQRKSWLEEHLAAEDRSFPAGLLIGQIAA